MQSPRLAWCSGRNRSISFLRTYLERATPARKHARRQRLRSLLGVDADTSIIVSSSIGGGPPGLGHIGLGKSLALDGHRVATPVSLSSPFRHRTDSLGPSLVASADIEAGAHPGTHPTRWRQNFQETEDGSRSVFSAAHIGLASIPTRRQPECREPEASRATFDISQLAGTCCRLAPAFLGHRGLAA